LGAGKLTVCLSLFDLTNPPDWMLSAAAAKTIREQINQDDDVIRNQSVMNEVLKTLPPL
jgi:hypothetical protein